MSEDFNCIVAERVLDMRKPYVESVQLDCKDCGLPCWVSRVMVEATQTEGTQVICMVCFAALVESQPDLIKQVQLHPKVLAEAEEQLRGEM